MTLDRVRIFRQSRARPLALVLSYFFTLSLSFPFLYYQRFFIPASISALNRSLFFVLSYCTFSLASSPYIFLTNPRVFFFGRARSNFRCWKSYEIPREFTHGSGARGYSLNSALEILPPFIESELRTKSISFPVHPSSRPANHPPAHHAKALHSNWPQSCRQNFSRSFQTTAPEYFCNFKHHSHRSILFFSSRFFFQYFSLKKFFINHGIP